MPTQPDYSSLLVVELLISRNPRIHIHIPIRLCIMSCGPLFPRPRPRRLTSPTPRLHSRLPHHLLLLSQMLQLFRNQRPISGKLRIVRQTLLLPSRFDILIPMHTPFDKARKHIIRMRRRRTLTPRPLLAPIFLRVPCVPLFHRIFIVCEMGVLWDLLVNIRVEVLAFGFGAVLARVRGLVFEHLDEFIEAGGEEGAKDGADPIDPVIAVKLVRHDRGTERTGGVNRTTCEVDT